MNICYVAGCLSPLNGTSVRTLNFAEALSKRHHKVVVLTPKSRLAIASEKRWSFEHISLRSVPAANETSWGISYLDFIRKSLRFLRDVRRIANERSIDIIHWENHYYSRLYLMLSGMLSGPSVCDLHASSSLEYGGCFSYSLQQSSENAICNRSDIVIVPTPELQKHLHSYVPRKQEKIIVVPNCIDLGRFPLSSNGRPIRKPLEASKKHFVVFYHGSPCDENIQSLQELKQIVSIMNQRGHPTKVVIAGRFQKDVVTCNHFRYLGYVEDMADYIRSSDIAVLPIHKKSLGLRSRILEYLAVGLPVVTTPDGFTGFPQVARGGAIKVVNSLNQMVEEAIELMVNLNLRYDCSRKAIEVAKDYFSYDAVVSKLELAYDHALLRD